MRWPLTNDRQELNHTYCTAALSKIPHSNCCKRVPRERAVPTECWTKRSGRIWPVSLVHRAQGSHREVIIGRCCTHAQPRPAIPTCRFRCDKPGASSEIRGDVYASGHGLCRSFWGGARYGGRQVHRVTRAAQRARTSLDGSTPVVSQAVRQGTALAPSMGQTWHIISAKPAHRGQRQHRPTLFAAPSGLSP